jgi:5-formyltetrahydrofolate cyclo-ligase
LSTELTKQDLRQYFIEQRKKQGSASRQQRSSIILSHCWQVFAKLSRDSVIAGYYPMRDEINILPLLQDLKRQGYQIALPAIKALDTALEFRQWNDDETLEIGQYFNIKQPSLPAPLLIPDLVIVPLLGCDLLGNRIGYGKGMYDRTLSGLRQSNPKLIAVGLCFQYQIMDKIEIEEHDQLLDMIISEQGVMLDQI